MEQLHDLVLIDSMVGDRQCQGIGEVIGGPSCGELQSNKVGMIVGCKCKMDKSEKIGYALLIV